jgi:D-alanyl-D-alanine carboxypeptidase
MRRMPHIRAALTCTAALLSHAATAQPDPARTEKADAIMRHAMEAGPYPGISVSIEQRGKTVYQRGFGYADLERKIPVTPQTRFPIGSITKSFTCLSVMQLGAAGRIGLDKTAGDYLPDLPAPSRDITIRQLLTHTSGIPNYTELPDFPMDKSVGLSRKDVVGYFASKPLLFRPGTVFNYSNSDTYLLGLIVEAVGGQSYDRYVETNILKRFGMTRSAFDARDDGATDRARGYHRTADGFRRSLPYDFEIPFAAGALVSTTPDMLRYRRGMFGPKTSAKVRDLALTQSPMADGTPNPYMLGCLVESSLDGHRKITHAGEVFGFAADYAYYPDDDLTIAIATNSQDTAFPAVSLERKLARLFLGLPPLVPRDEPVPADLGQALAGDYDLGPLRIGFDRIGFVFANGTLSAVFGGTKSGAPSLPLRYQGNGRFLSSADEEQTLDFKRNADGSVGVTLYAYEGRFAARKPAPNTP